MSLVHNERGMVLLLVLMVVALLATVLTELSFSTLVDMRLAETFRDSTRAGYLARGGLQVGQRLLQDDNNNYDGTDELWAIGVQQYPVADGAVTIEITDLGGRVDLNRLVTPQGNIDVVIKDRYLRLLQQLDIDQPAALVGALIDWIDQDDLPEANGAENSVYLARAEPYQCKNGPLDTLEELVLIQGYSPELLQRLRPHVTAYGSAKVNVNTASREVLLSLSEQMNVTAVDIILAARQEEPFVAISQIKDLPGMETLYGFLYLYIDVKSERYQIESTAWVNDGRSSFFAIVAKGNSQILFQRVL
ncbi:MAG: type II secretion system minor pseudopilin GspK [Desulfuromonadales bacterium]|nr:type II secretion system minor pseudopilin GspK [Desulfuromonadales bacterium]